LELVSCITIVDGEKIKLTEENSPGFINSTKYPATIPNGDVCTWYFTLPDNYDIEFDFINVNLAWSAQDSADGTCSIDFIKVSREH